LIVQVDGGHIPVQQAATELLEALSAVIYRPEQMQVDKNHRQIIDKLTSAVNDKSMTIKAM